MNKCYLLGQVCNEPNFEFLYHSSYISISSFTLQTSYGDYVQIIGYDDWADYIYRYIHIAQNLSIEGTVVSIDNSLFVQVNYIEIIKKNRNK